MINDIQNRRDRPAITSDRWHVIRASWSGRAEAIPVFDRSIVSEHENRAAAVLAARSLLRSLVAEMDMRPDERRDHVLVRPPAYKSLKSAKRIRRRRK